MLLALCFLLFAGINTANTRIIKSSETASFHSEANRYKRAPVNLSLSNGNGTKTANFELQLQNANNKGTVLGQQIVVPESQHTQQVKPVNYKTQMKNASNDATLLNHRVEMLMPGTYGNELPLGLPGFPDNMQVIRKAAYTTMFDKDRGRPLYSVYLVNAQDAKNLHNYEKAWKKDPKNTKFTAQEYKDMYKKLTNQVYPLQKGHLNPAHLNSYDLDKWHETYFFENVVPQYSAFNNGPWKTGENRMLKFVREWCAPRHGVVYFLTGVSDNYVDNNNRPKFKHNPDSVDIKIPNSMWTAACCVSIKSVDSVAVMGNNVPTNSEMQLQQLSLVDLQNRLGPGVQLFPHNENACENDSPYDL